MASRTSTAPPTLIRVFATNGTVGYAYVADMNIAWGEPTSPEHALELQEGRAGEGVAVPVYELDSETVIGEFVVGGSASAPRRQRHRHLESLKQG